MSDSRKTKAQLVEELKAMRAELASVRGSDAMRADAAPAWDLTSVCRDSPLGLCVVDHDLHVVHANATLAAILGRTPDQIVGKSIDEIPSDVLRAAELALRQTLEVGGQTIDVEYPDTFERLSGATREFQLSCYPVTSPTGSVIGAGIIIQSPADRNHVDDPLRLLQSAVDEASFGVFIATSDIRPPGPTIVYVNQALAEMTGYTVAELTGKHGRILHGPKTDQDVAERAVAAMERGESISGELLKYRKDGSEFWVRSHASPLRDATGRIQYWLVTQLDITPNKDAEEVLRESESRFREMAEHIRDVFWLQSPDLRDVIYVSPAFETLWEVSRDQLGEDPTSWLSLVHDDDRERVEGAFFGGQVADELVEEYRIVRRDGSIRWINDRLYPVRDEQGHVQRVARISRGVTARKEAAAALSAGEVRYRTLAENASDMICRIQPDNVIIDVSPACRSILGYEPEEMIGHTGCEFVHPDDIATLSETWLREINDREMATSTIRVRRKDGEYVWLENSGQLIRQPSTGKVMEIATVSRDVTDRQLLEEHNRRLQADLMHVARLASMGEMVSALTHELNQPLGVIANDAQACARGLRTGKLTTEHMVRSVEEIATAALRAGEIIRRLRRFVAKRTPNRSTVDVNELVREVGRLMNPDVRAHAASLELKLDPQIPFAYADRVHIQQVLVNLVRNSLEALDQLDPAKRRLQILTSVQDGAVLVAVTDSGKGYTNDLLEAYFEPYFTTKAFGLGLGLSISRSIISSHGGRLWASADSEGHPTFQFTLPDVRVAPDDGA